MPTVLATQELRDHGFEPLVGPSLEALRRARTRLDCGEGADPDDNGDEKCVVGVSRQGGTVQVLSSRGASIGTEAEMDELTEFLEGMANDSQSFAANNEKSSEDSAYRSTEATTIRCRRRLVPPEICFPGAYVAIRFQLRKLDGSNRTAEEDEGSHVEIRFDSRHALAEWAEAHGPLSSASEAEEAAPVLSVDNSGGIRGVAIMKTVHAQLWSQKGREGIQRNSAKLSKRTSPVGKRSISTADGRSHETEVKSLLAEPRSAVKSSSAGSDFRYDWTYSSPFGGAINLHHKYFNNQPNPILSNGRNLWSSVVKSGIDVSLLSDRSQPILYYDDINLYEDDLHDNGTSHLNVKVRVMPRCVFILYRLFVRVDYVTIRVRDVRLYHLFGSSEVWRDAMWRECSWSALADAGLPDDIGGWRLEDGATAAATVQGLIGRLPPCKIPDDIPAHSKLDLSSLRGAE